MTSSLGTILLFMKIAEDGISFPYLPTQIYDSNYSFYVLDRNTGKCVVKFNNFNSHVDVQEAIFPLLDDTQLGMAPPMIYSVHPTNVLLPLLRWTMLRKGVPASTADMEIRRFIPRTVDICEAFHRPAILSLDRRQNFNYEEIAQQLDLHRLEAEGNEGHCLRVITHLCRII